MIQILIVAFSVKDGEERTTRWTSLFFSAEESFRQRWDVVRAARLFPRRPHEQHDANSYNKQANGAAGKNEPAAAFSGEILGSFEIRDSRQHRLSGEFGKLI
jgi:hypothetical protein